MKKTKTIAIWLARIALSLGFLSAVADRFGLWGVQGAPRVAWGNMNSFIAYSSDLNAWAPKYLQAPIAWTATIAELLLGIGLLVGFKLKWVSLASALLLLCFFVAMTVYLGPKVPIDYSVLPAAAAALLIYTESPKT